MRKKVLTLAVGAALACMPMTALADVSLTSLGTKEDVDWISGSNLLAVEGSEGYGVSTIEDEMLTEQIYGRSISFEKGHLVARKADEELNSSGMLSTEGKELIPFQYGDVEVESKHWALGIVLKEATADHYDYSSFIGEGYYLMDKIDVYYINEGTASCVASLGRENYMDCYAEGDYINIEDRSNGVITRYDSAFTAVETDVNMYEMPEEAKALYTYRENGQEGVKDSEGNVVMEPAFYMIYSFEGNYARTSTGEKEGLIDAQGNVVIPAEYDDIESSYYGPADADGEKARYGAYGYFAVVKDGKFGYVSEGGAVTCEPKYAEGVVDNNGVSALITDMEGNTILQAADGTETVLEGYDNIHAMEYGAGMLYKVCDADYNYGVIDWHGKEVLPCQYNGVALSGDGRYLLVDSAEDYGTSELYEVTVDITADAAAPTESVLDSAEEAEEPEEAAAEAAEEPEEAAEEAAAEGSSDLSGTIGTLLDSAAAILEQDSEANRTSAAELLKSAASLLGESNEAAKTILESAVTLLQTEGSDLASIGSLISSVKGML